MTRFASLFVATAVAILPISVVAQTSMPPAKADAPASATSTANMTTPTIAKTKVANVNQTPKSNVKTLAPGAKTETHSMNTVNPHNAKTIVPAKNPEPSKS